MLTKHNWQIGAVKMLPKWVLYWALMVIVAELTTDEPKLAVPELTCMEAARRWGDKYGI